MVDLAEYGASYLLHIGKFEEGLEAVRKLKQIQDPGLIRQLCDLADPTVKKKRGRPSKQHDEDHKNEQFKVYAFFRFRRAWHEYQGMKDAATQAKEETLEHFEIGSSWFEQAHKRFTKGFSYQSQVQFYIDEWLKSEPKAPPQWARLEYE
jgi:hypothetical protein